MPAKNSIKTYIENGYYHIYNRGVEKRNIFLDEQDYRVFLSYLKIYLLPKEEYVNNLKNMRGQQFENNDKVISEIYMLNNFFNKIYLISYVLMPNHFHLELKQTGKKDIEIFMRSLVTKYTMYFNKKYHRVGPLFQGRYKAVLIQSKEYLLHLSRYIHTNPYEIVEKSRALDTYQWSSYSAYINNYSINWLNKNIILDYFSVTQKIIFKSYKCFVEDYIEQSEEEKNSYTSLILD